MTKRYRNILEKGITFLLAGSIFVLLVYFSMNYDKGTKEEYKIVCFGDSNLGNVQDETGITALLEKRMEQPVLNAAFGGSSMTNVSRVKTDYSSVLSMHNLATSISNRNYGMQKSVIEDIERTNYLNYFYTTLENIMNVDFEKVDIVIIEHGVNDYLNGVSIKNGKNEMDTDTFTGTIRCIVTMLKKSYPNLRIILSTPTYCATIGDGGVYRYCDEYDFGGGFLEDYVNAEIEVANELGVEVIDAYHLMDIQKENVVEYMKDGLHLDEQGRKEIADLWADYLLGVAQ